MKQKIVTNANMTDIGKAKRTARRHNILQPSESRRVKSSIWYGYSKTIAVYSTVRKSSKHRNKEPFRHSPEAC